MPGYYDQLLELAKLAKNDKPRGNMPAWWYRQRDMEQATPFGGDELVSLPPAKKQAPARVSVQDADIEDPMLAKLTAGVGASAEDVAARAMKPQQAAVNTKVAAEQVDLPSKPAELTDADKIKQAMEYASNLVREREGMSNILEGGARIGNAFAGVEHDPSWYAEMRKRAGDESKSYFDRVKDIIIAEQQAKRAKAEEAYKARDFGMREQGMKDERERYAGSLAETSRHNKAIEAVQRAAGQQRGATNPMESPKFAADLRKEFSGLPEVKTFKDVEVSYDKVQRAAQNPSAAGDLSLIFAYMKMLDPGSTVREGEFANAQNSAGVPDRIAAQYNKIVSGERLSNDVRADFVNQARSAYEAHRAQLTPVIERYRGFAGKAGLSPDDVAVGARQIGPGQQQPAGPTPTADEILAKLRGR